MLRQRKYALSLGCYLRGLRHDVGQYFSFARPRKCSFWLMLTLSFIFIKILFSFSSGKNLSNFHWFFAFECGLTNAFSVSMGVVLFSLWLNVNRYTPTAEKNTGIFQHEYLPANFAKFPNNTHFVEHLRMTASAIERLLSSSQNHFQVLEKLKQCVIFLQIYQ